MTAYALIQESVSFGSDPPVVTCAVETPSGQIDVYQYGVDPQIARASTGNYQIQIPQTVNGTDANPYIFYWQPGGITQLLPPTGVIIPPPAPPPPPGPGPVVTPHLTPSAQPGLFVPGLAEPGLPGSVAVAAPGSPAPPPPVPPPPGPTPLNLPDTTSGFHQALIFNYNIGTTPETGIDYVWGSTNPTGAAGIHERYYPWSQASTDRGTIYTYAWFEANHPNWILYRSDQTTYAQYTFDAGNPATIDITQSAVQDWIIANWIAPNLAAGFSGISVDDDPSDNVFNAAGHWSGTSGARSGSWVPQYSGATVDSAWASAQATALTQFISKIRAAYPNATITVNNGYFPGSTTHMTAASGWDPIIYNTGASMLLDERAFSGGVSGGQLTDTNWGLKMAKLSAVAQTKGLTLIYQEGYTVTANMTAGNAGAKADLQWALANYFLVKGSHTYFFWGGNSQYGFAPIPQTEFTTVQAIGSATNTYFATLGAYRRDYTNGLVFVNSSSTTTSSTITIPASTYKDLYGNIQPASFTIPAHTGLVLLHV